MKYTKSERNGNQIREIEFGTTPDQMKMNDCFDMFLEGMLLLQKMNAQVIEEPRSELPEDDKLPPLIETQGDILCGL